LVDCLAEETLKPTLVLALTLYVEVDVEDDEDDDYSTGAEAVHTSIPEIERYSFWTVTNLTLFPKSGFAHLTVYQAPLLPPLTLPHS
jgi:hypothetical protein